MKAVHGSTHCILAHNEVPPPRPLLCKRYKPTKNELKGRMLTLRLRLRLRLKLKRKLKLKLGWA